jgi:hypothetical protein
MSDGNKETSVTQTPFERGKVVASPPRPPVQTGSSAQQSANNGSGKK